VLPDLQQVYSQAINAHEKGEYELAVELYAQLLAEHPDADLVLYNQGLALYALDRFAEAATAFLRITEISRPDADTWYNLGLALKGCDRLSEARAAYEQALLLQVDEDTLFNLGNCCRELGAIDDAFTYYERVLAIDSGNVSALNNYAYLCHRQGDYKKAEILYKKLLQLDSNHPGATHMLAALSGSANVAPDKNYVQDLFDQYSAGFEKSLVEKLDYQVPGLLFACVKEYFPQIMFQEAVDLGCGTGLAGELFTSCCRTLAGVDLSPNMVTAAACKKIYARLEVADVVEFVANLDYKADLFVAADLLTYLADLQPLFTTLSKASSKGAVFVFSTEHGNTENWQVRPTGRFAHGRAYVADTLIAAGAEIISVKKEKIRREGDDWVLGDIYLAVFE